MCYAPRPLTSPFHHWKSNTGCRFDESEVTVLHHPLESGRGWVRFANVVEPLAAEARFVELRVQFLDPDNHAIGVPSVQRRSARPGEHGSNHRVSVNVKGRREPTPLEAVILVHSARAQRAKDALQLA